MSVWDLWRSVDWGQLLVSTVAPERLRPLDETPAPEGRKLGCEAAEACVETYGTLLTLADGTRQST